MDPTFAIPFHPRELWSNNPLSKFRLMVTGLKLVAPHPSPQKQCTREDVSGTERSLRSTTLASLASASRYSRLSSSYTDIPAPAIQDNVLIPLDLPWSSGTERVIS